jgi:hypothetical protein
MGFIRKLLGAGKKAIIAGGLAAILAACASGTGIKLDQNYPELTETRKARIESQMLWNIEKDARVISGIPHYDPRDWGKTEDRPVVQFQGPIQEWINHLSDMMEYDKDADGVSFPGIQNIRISIVPRSGIIENCGEQAGACNGRSHIYMPDYWNIITHLAVDFHEFGHTFFPGSQEFPAKGNEVFMGLKAYQFSKPIGSLLLRTIFAGIDPTNPNDYSAFSRMYKQGAIYSIFSLNKHHGNIEAAMNDIAHSKTIVLETELQNKLDTLDGPTLGDKYMQMWKELLDKSSFFEELTGPTGHLEATEAKELIHFLKILNYESNYYNSSDRETANEKLHNLRHSFLKNTDFTNPLFYAEALHYHNFFMQNEKMKIQNEHGINSKEYSDYAEEVLGFYSRFPCYELNPFTCKKEFREIRYDHINAYYDIIKSSLAQNTEQKDQVVFDQTIDYLEKFYSGLDFESGDFEALAGSSSKMTNNYAVYFSSNAGSKAIMRGQMNIAEKMLTIAATIPCLEGGYGLPQLICQNYQDYAQTFLENYFPEDNPAIVIPQSP